MFIEQKFVIYHDNGKVEFIDDMYSYVWKFGGINRFYGSMKFNLGAFKEKKSQQYGSWFDKSFEHDHGFYLFVNGKMVSPDLFIGEWNAYQPYYWSKQPRTRRYYGRCWRYSHTTRNRKKVCTIPAKRAACGVVKEEGEPPFRGKRSKGYMPDYWDDLFSRASCSWKNCTKRKRQYKGN